MTTIVTTIVTHEKNENDLGPATKNDVRDRATENGVQNPGIENGQDLVIEKNVLDLEIDHDDLEEIVREHHDLEII